jgi:hypothetical protein
MLVETGEIKTVVVLFDRGESRPANEAQGSSAEAPQTCAD